MTLLDQFLTFLRMGQFFAIFTHCGSIDWNYSLLSCTVSHENFEIWPIHSFQNETICFDNRLNVQMPSQETTYLNPVIEFEMRSFRFRDGKPPNVKQEQAISCSLMLSDTSTTIENNTCECYNEDECGE